MKHNTPTCTYTISCDIVGMRSSPELSELNWFISGHHSGKMMLRQIVLKYHIDKNNDKVATDNCRTQSPLLTPFVSCLNDYCYLIN